MLDPRIYRTGLIVAALALVVLAFSLGNQPGALSPTLAPDAFNGHNAYATMETLAAAYPSRRPGSPGDEDVATQVFSTLSQDGFAPTKTTFSGRTVDGTRTLENVVGVRPGVKAGSIVVVAPRDALGSGAEASLSGTAALMELANDLQGETLNHTVVLASTSGTQGGAGARALAAGLPQPIDAVLVLGDLASAHAHQPVLIPWSTRQTVAPPVLRNTLASVLSAQGPVGAGNVGLGGQFAHLAFPFTLGGQGPFAARGIPAIELSLSGERGPAPDAPVNAATVTAAGRAVLEAISALDSGPKVPAPSSYLLLAGKVVPGWALSLFVLALLVPVAMTTVDGVARALRRGHAVGRAVILVLAAAIPFAAAVLVVALAGLAGIISIAPPGPVVAGAVPIDGAGVAVLAVAALAMLGTGAAVAAYAHRSSVAAVETRRRSRASRLGGEDVRGRGDGAAAGLLCVMCAVTFVIWLGNPFAALLLIPALHLWLWAISSDLRMPGPVRALLIILGVAPTALVVAYYAFGLGYGPVALIWQAALLLAGGGVSLLAAIEWSIALGCLASVVALAFLAAQRSRRAAPMPVTVRGPVTYAGPGSLGGTKSAIRR